MSSEALAWAFKQDIKPSSVKFTLVALCECANYKTGLIFPSIAHLSEITGQDRKTVISNIAELERRGLIVDTGDRSGKTKQVKVYSAAIGTVPNLEQSQSRNSSEFPKKQSRKRDTEPSREPSSSEAKASSDKRATPSNENWHRLPDDWTPAKPLSAELAAKVAQWPPGKIESELSALRDWAANASNERGKGRKLDWDRAWQGWLRRADEDWRRRNGSAPRPVQQSPDGRSMGRTEAASRSAYEKLAASGNFRVGSQTGPALAGGNNHGPIALPDPDRPQRYDARRPG